MDRIYKGFGIVKNGSRWEIWTAGVMVRACKTLKECKERIDNQTV